MSIPSKKKAPAERVPDTSAGAGKKVTFVPQLISGLLLVLGSYMQ